MTSRNPTASRPSSRPNASTHQILHEARHAPPTPIQWPNSSTSAALSSHLSARQSGITAPALPVLSTEEQRRNGNSFYQKALRAGRIHGSSSASSASTVQASRDGRLQNNRSTEDGVIGGRPRRGKDIVPGIDTRGMEDDAVVLEDNEIVKRDANGDYESFLTADGQIYQDLIFSAEKMGEGMEAEEAAKQRDRELFDLYRSQRGQQIDLAEMHSTNMTHLREMTNALDDDNWMYESDDHIREQLS